MIDHGFFAARPIVKPRAAKGLAALAISVMGALSAQPAVALDIEELEFELCHIRDILIALAKIAHINAVPDESVLGQTSFRYLRSSGQDGFMAFLAANRLYLRQDGDLALISRIRLELDDAGLVSLDAEDVELSLVLREFSRALGQPVLAHDLAPSRVSLHLRGQSPLRALQLACSGIGNRRMVEDNGAFFLMPAETAPKSGSPSDSVARPSEAQDWLKRSADGLYCVHAVQVPLGRLVGRLMELEGREYYLIKGGDANVDRLEYADRDFPSMLDLILEQGGLDWAERGGVIYVFEARQRDLSRSLRESQRLILKNLGAQEALAMLPGEYAASGLARVDKAGNALLLVGSKEELRPLRDFILRLDGESPRLEYLKIRLSRLRAKELASFLPGRLLAYPPLYCSDERLFVAAVPRESVEELEAAIKALDFSEESKPILLRYLSVEELLRNLPPSANKEEICPSGLSSLAFHTGSGDNYRRLLAEIEQLDRPKPQIHYDILALQYDRSRSFAWNPGLSHGHTQSGQAGDEGSSLAQPSGETAWSLVAKLSGLSSLNFDIVSKLGLDFAASLEASLGDSRTQLLTDTTITSISGQEARFQNTSTVRYRESQTDSETGLSSATGAARELSSGLIISVNGWVAPSGTVSMKVQVTVSERSQSEESSSQLILPTTERVVSSQVQTMAGRPVVISGLLSSSTSEGKSGPPLLARIPLLGSLISRLEAKRDDKEIAIYILPRVEGLRESLSEPQSFQRALETFRQSLGRLDAEASR